MKRIVLASLVLLPVLASADAAANAAAQAGNFVEDLNRVILFPTIALLSGIAMLVFLFGCFQYIAMAGNDAARQKGVSHITWGIVGLVVMVSAYAILSIVTATFDLDDELGRANDADVVVPITTS